MLKHIIIAALEKELEGYERGGCSRVRKIAGWGGRDGN